MQAHLHLGPRNARHEVRLVVRVFPENEVPVELESTLLLPPRQFAAAGLDAQIADNVQREFSSLRKMAASNAGFGGYLPDRVLLEIEPADLVTLDWEGLLYPAMPHITRFRPVSDMRVLEPFEPPVGVLRVLRRPSGGFAEPTEGSMRYFREHRVLGATNANLPKVVRGAGCEIVHLLADARERPVHHEQIDVIVDPEAPDTVGIGARALSNALAACHARLLLLQCARPDGYPPMLAFAHQLARLGAPSTLVLAGVAPATLDDFFMQIVHDQPLYPRQYGGGPPAALFHGIGGAQPFRLKRVAEGLLRASQQTDIQGRRLMDLAERAAPRRVRFGGPGPGKSTRSLAPAALPDIGAELAANLSATQRLYDYSRESGAWIPLPKDLRVHARAAAGVEQLQRSVGRVLNVGFKRAGEALDSWQSLEPGSPCQLSVQIGRRAEWSQIDGDAAFPEQAIERLYTQDGVKLRVVVFAPSFKIGEPDRPLYLQPPPAESNELQFELTCPEEPGWHRVRVCVYKDLNLLQSVLARVHVGSPAERTRGVPAIDVGVEFALTSTLEGMEQLPARRLNLLCNGTDDGTHTFAIAASTFTRTFDFGDTEMRGAVGAARDALYAIAADVSVDPPQYRFDHITNATDVRRFEQDLIKLAELGAELYSKILIRHERSFADALEKELGVRGATIQISAAKSGRYVFPWALVYDHSLMSGALTLCPQFKSELPGLAGRLEQQTCLLNGCPNRHRTDVVCPSGFWGYKHAIEQPFSVETRGGGPRQIILEIQRPPAGLTLNALMIVSRELQQVRDHQGELRGTGAYGFAVKDTKVEAFDCLQDPARSSHLVYFYCHGGREKTLTWLGIGKGAAERLLPGELVRSRSIDWTGTHPLVFINGCHTADFTPDDLLNFNEALNYCGAAGVIGTEISVPESLARCFARGFLPLFLTGRKVGEALRQQRLDLLERGNVLGLAYTPYCSVDLQLV